MSTPRAADQHGDPGGDRRERRHPLHEGHARGARAAASPPARSRSLEALGTPFAAVDILPDPRIRQELSALSNWPTIPQLFVRGELVGGCDIVTEMYESGELAEALGVEQPRRRGAGRDEAGAPLTIENRLNR